MRYLISNGEKPVREVVCNKDQIDLQLIEEGETATELADDHVIDWQIPDMAPSLNSLKAAAKRDIDNAADRARKRYITDIAAQAAIYQIKYAEAVAYQGDNTAIGVYLQDEADRTNSPVTDVAQLFIDKNTAWETLGVATETVRLSAKADIDLLAETATPADVDLIVDNAVALLDDI